MASNTRKTIVRDSVFRSTDSGIRAATEAAEPEVLTRSEEHTSELQSPE